MNLFKEVHKTMTRSILEAESSSLKEKVAEHNEISKQMAVISIIAKAFGSRIKALETEMTPIIKEMDKQMKVVDNTILTYKEKKGTGIKYKEGFEKALEIVNKKQQAVLNEVLASVTTKSVKDTLTIADPDLANFVKELKDIAPEDLITKVGALTNFPKQIKNKKKREGKMTKESLVKEAGIVDKAKKLVQKGVEKISNIFKMIFSKVEKKVDLAGMAIDDLVRRVGDGTVNESNTAQYVRDDIIERLMDTYDMSSVEASAFMFGGMDLGKDFLDRMIAQGYDDGGDSYEDSKEFWDKAGIKKEWIESMDFLMNENTLTEADVLHKRLYVTLRKTHNLTDAQVENMSNAIEHGAEVYAEYIAQAHNDATDEDKISDSDLSKITKDLEDFILSKLG